MTNVINLHKSTWLSHYYREVRQLNESYARGVCYKTYKKASIGGALLKSISPTTLNQQNGSERN